MKTIEIVIEYKGAPVRVSDGRVFGRAFGTTIHNHSMHYSWMDITDNLSSELKQYLKDNNLI